MRSGEDNDNCNGKSAKVSEPAKHAFAATLHCRKQRVDRVWRVQRSDDTAILW